MCAECESDLNHGLIEHISRIEERLSSARVDSAATAKDTTENVRG